jgi:hypothetical protein
MWKRHGNRMKMHQIHKVLKQKICDAYEAFRRGSKHTVTPAKIDSWRDTADHWWELSVAFDDDSLFYGFLMAPPPNRPKPFVRATHDLFFNGEGGRRQRDLKRRVQSTAVRALRRIWGGCGADVGVEWLDPALSCACELKKALYGLRKYQQFLGVLRPQFALRRRLAPFLRPLGLRLPVLRYLPGVGVLHRC